MNQTMLLSIAMTGFTVAFFHAAIPTHWLPFVMAARAQKWNKAKTLGVTAIAGAGHVLFTTVLGILIVWLGIELGNKIGEWFPVVAGGALMAFGVFYIVQQARGKGHSHSHFGFGHHHHHDHSHDHHHHGLTDTEILKTAKISLKEAEEKTQSLLLNPNQGHHHGTKTVSDKVAILSLLAMLTFSPCEGFLPVYLSGISYGWVGFVILSAILAVGTLLGMVLFTWLTLAGMEKLKLAFLEKYESALMGGLLCILGLAVIIFER
jgi:ABC-type nickel/cobalt efflux system permease component RcnA